MRKFYSLVLIAAGLLIGTNAQAKLLVGSDWAALQGAVDAIMSGNEADQTIKLNGPVILDGANPIWIGTTSLTAAYKSITLDLNGQKISMSKTGEALMFVLTHGELNVINTAEQEGVIELDGGNSSSQIFSVYGSYRSSRWNEDGTDLVASGAINTRAANGGWFSHLEIGQNVKVFAKDGCEGAGIAVDVIAYGKNFKTTLSNTNKLTYGTQLKLGANGGTPTAQYGYAYGVRVDVKGKVDIQGKSGSDSKSYGVKVNGYCSSPLSANISEIKTKLDGTNEVAYLSNYHSYNGEISAGTKTHKLDTLDAPFIYVHPSAEVKSRQTGNKSTAIYASGYAKWMLDGAVCEGKTGVYVSSGEIDIHDAQIASTAETYEKPDKKGSANGGGSGIVVNSRDSYAGDIDITISGDTKVEGAVGYAIEEIVNTVNEETKVEKITIEGGTIQEGDKGAIALNSGNKTVVVAGNIQGVIEDNGVEKPLSNFVDPTTSHITVVQDEYGNSIYAVSEGSAPTEGNMVSTQATGASVKWIINTEDAISGYKKLKELEINTNGLVQTLTINANATLEVGRVVLGKDARIVVEAGGKLIVTGKDGIVAPSVNNITLKTSEAAQAILLFDPEVNFNRHPNATVELYSKAYKKANGDYVWQRFGVPTWNDNLVRTDINYDHTAAPTAWRKIEHQDWVTFDAEEGMVPFVCYGLTTTATSAIGVYEFRCPLMGNDNATLKLTDEWNYYANSYMAPINIPAVLGALASNVEGTMYLYRASDNWWYEINNGALAFDEDNKLPRDIDPMQAFIIHRRAEEGENPVINYASQIYTPVVSQLSAAPARSHNSLNKAMVEIVAEDGTKDCVRMIEDAQFSADFDNSYDATKYMNENSFNLFAGEKLGIIATDNLEGTTLSMNTKEQTTFTMTISHVNGMNYAIRDNFTGTEIEMVEGATYMFSTAANANIEGRFEIVPVAKMPTAIENIEATAAAKGIYTITGQFVGNDYHSLPNGVYVVDGKKIVK